MLSDRIPTQGIQGAIDSTFSGKQPCETCKSITQFQIEEEDSSSDHKSTNSPEQKPNLLASHPAQSLFLKLHKAVLHHPLGDSRPFYSISTPVHGPPPKLIV